MIAQVAQLFGGDERAIQLARKLTFAIMWLSEWEVYRLIAKLTQEITTLKARNTRAA